MARLALKQRGESILVWQINSVKFEDGLAGARTPRLVERRQLNLSTSLKESL